MAPLFEADRHASFVVRCARRFDAAATTVVLLATAVVVFAAGLSAGPSPLSGAEGVSSTGDGIQIDTRVAADSVTVGERLQIRYRASYPESLVLLPPESFDTGTCRLVSLTWRNDKEKGRRIKEARLTVMAVDLEEARLPGAAFHFLTPRGDTLIAYGDEVLVPVREMTGERDEPQPLKPQWRAPRSYFYYYVAAAALLLAALAVYLWRRRGSPAEEAPREPEIPADVVAMEALARIEEMKLLEAGEFKRYYTLVIDAVRHYLERRFGVMAMDRTTGEILADLDIIRVRVEELEPLLREADLVKFAKFQPDAADGRIAMDRAREIVVQTALAPQAAGPEVRQDTESAGRDPGTAVRDGPA